MRTRAVKALLSSEPAYVCLACRLRSVGAGRGRRYQHAAPSERRTADPEHTKLSESPEKENSSPADSASSVRDIIQSFLLQNGSTEEKKENESGTPRMPNSQPGSKRPGGSSKPEHSKADIDLKQKVLQQKFAAQRRQQMLELQANESPKRAEANQPSPEPISSSNATITRPKRPTRRENRMSRAARRVQAKLEKAAVKAKVKVAKKAQGKLEEDSRSILDLDLLNGLPSNEVTSSASNTESDADQRDKPDNGTNEMDFPRKSGARAQKNSTATADSKEKVTLNKPITTEQKAKIGKDNSKQKKQVPQQPEAISEKDSSSEKEGKGALAKRPTSSSSKSTTRGSVAGEGVGSAESGKSVRRVVDRKIDEVGKSRKASTKISDITGFDSLQGAIGRKAARQQVAIEKADATRLKILPLKVDQPPVPGLAYGLERVLFNPGVYQLQDPRSRVFNFDPYLQKIMPVAEFDFNALKEYITSSKDESLKRIAKEHGKRYVGSTSSMTGALAHFHFLLSQWRPIDASMLSKNFPANLSSFTELQRTPSAIFLRWKDGSYAIDADKEFASANILSMLGKSMEKLLTLDMDDYEKYRKSGSAEVSDEEQLTPESYHYSTMGDFLMRSQLDAHDPRLPGTGMFDLKTRAVVSIRMDVTNYEHGVGYQIKSRQGEWESFEREYYDMIRAAFLKYSMQVRMGRMDGIFVAFHNIERIFGFQYISLPEMDSTIHGQWDTSLGDQEFKLSLDLLNKILDKATKKFPETSLRIHFETRDAATPFMYIFAEPVTEEQVAEIQSQKDAKIQEFERNILGLNRKNESEAQDNQEEDGKWDNIQASVQEAMDEDELSVDDPSKDQESQDEEAEEVEVATKHRGVRNEGPLYASKDRISSDKHVITANVGRDVDQVAWHDSTESDELSEEEDQHQGGDEGSDADTHNESEAGIQVKESDKHEIDEQDGHEIALEEGSAVIEDPADKDLEPHRSAKQTSDVSDLPKPDADVELEDGKKPPEAEPMKGLPSDTSDERIAEGTEKAGYMAPLMSEQPSVSEYQTEADGPFLDAMDGEPATVTTSLSPSSEILALTLTLRNKVNDKFVHRPVNLTSEDVWSIEYNLLEVPTQKKAKALYEACHLRRKKKLDSPVVPEDAEVISQYLANLRKMSSSGREWRKKLDEKDSKKAVQVLGKEITRDNGEGSLSDQEPEA